MKFSCPATVRATMPVLFVLLALGGCSPPEGTTKETAAVSVAEPAPRFDDGTLNLDRVAGSDGYWGEPSLHSLIETGVEVPMDNTGLLADINDAGKVAPFMDWSLALYKYRQSNGLKDDPVNVCISPAGPRHLQNEGGFRIIQDHNLNRVYLIFGGGNRNWRLISMDGREPPDPDEVTGTYYGYSTGHWDGDTLVVESSGFNDRFWFSNGGLPHTAALHLTERFSRPDYNTLVYQVVVNDPHTYTRPWTAQWSLKWVAGEMKETFCEQ